MVVLSILFQVNLTAQKHDYNWIFGYGDFTGSVPNRYGLWLDFNGINAKASVFNNEECFFSD
jgi:hypothetical protein